MFIIAVLMLFFCFSGVFFVVFIVFGFLVFFVDKRKLLSTGESVISWSNLLRTINMFNATQHVDVLRDVIRFASYS